jgi:hypothetical protein
LWDKETLTPVTVALMYGVYAANIGTFVLCVRRRSWPLPLPRPAHRCRTDGHRCRFSSVPQLSGVEPSTLVTGGLCRRTRNLQYLGIVAAVAGIGIGASSGLAGAIAVTVSTGGFGMRNVT